MITLYNDETGEPLFSSNSVYGIIDLILINWANDQYFNFDFNNATKKITINEHNYYFHYVAVSGNPRGDIIHE